MLTIILGIDRSEVGGRGRQDLSAVAAAARWAVAGVVPFAARSNRNSPLVDQQFTSAPVGEENLLRRIRRGQASSIRRERRRTGRTGIQQRLCLIDSLAGNC